MNSTRGANVAKNTLKNEDSTLFVAFSCNSSDSHFQMCPS